MNTWTHIAATLDGTYLRLYVNGTLVASKRENDPIKVTNAPVRIGRDLPQFNKQFKGRIDDIRIYRTALTPEQIQSDMNTPVAQAAGHSSRSAALMSGGPSASPQTYTAGQQL
ncbi:hypothetical protein HD597_000164 [Nonomuraea thailandensis]|uniref:LamG domain-containing protein n=1 Tax=Nonomuraea thailandensis TaxID=1188745 RepID=A0A9X2G5W0_9ACTN|nr:hypothetical protein [Nonomuraea thailandensis]